MEMGSIFYKGHEFFDEKLVEQDCIETQTIEMHKKKKSECHNVTKQNCVTKWVVLPSGEKVGTPEFLINEGLRLSILGKSFPIFF